MFSTRIRKSGSPSVQHKEGAFFQPKLTINAPGDKHEQEADTMAERVVQAPQGQAPVSAADATASLQRQAEDREEEPVQRQPEKKEEEKPPVQMMPLMRKSAGGGFTATAGLSNRLSASKGGGSALPAPARAHMESAFGADFSRVRIHTDRGAAEMNAGINARAFTHGSDIYFNSGQYTPESREGKRLLAHELTHVVQQKSISKLVQKKEENQSRTENIAKGIKSIVTSDEKEITRIESIYKDRNDVIQLPKITREQGGEFAVAFYKPVNVAVKSGTVIGKITILGKGYYGVLVKNYSELLKKVVIRDVTTVEFCRNIVDIVTQDKQARIVLNELLATVK